MPAKPTSLEEFVGRARRRAIAFAVAACTVNALSLALAAAALILVVGTDLVPWGLPLVVFVLALGAILWMRRAALPREYDTAQRLDSILGLDDLLSSAWHAARAASASRLAPPLLAQAEAEARLARPDQALRWRWPRSARWTLLAALAVLALFVLRFGVLRTLDLRASVVPALFDVWSTQTASNEKPKPKDAKLPQPIEIGLDVPGDSTEKLAGDDLLKSESPGESDSGKPVNAMRPNQQSAHAPGEAEAPDDMEENVNLPAGVHGESSGANQRQSNDVKGPRKNASRAPEKQNSLLDKMRDALANLMEKLKPNGQAGQSPQNAAALEGQPQPGQHKPGDKNNPNPGQPRPGDPRGEQSQEQADASQAGQNSQSDSSLEPGAEQQRSGIGRQNGIKNTELAKEAQAMGQLSELIGKRSLSLQGEMTVEVETSANPQLRTPYLNRSATHAEAGGDLSRDEVPLRHRDFVRRYYEQIRSQPDSLPPAAPKTTANPH
ncbi:MAG: hypothetical protein ACLQBJ_17380 [Bryobacteraceae bacterium]